MAYRLLILVAHRYAVAQLIKMMRKKQRQSAPLQGSFSYCKKAS